jgi:hypothetical protein
MLYNVAAASPTRLAGANTAISGWNLQPLLFDANVTIDTQR